MENTLNENQPIEQKVIDLLGTYTGSNNYILKLKRLKEINKKFFPSRTQCEYVINYYNLKPKVARKWIDIDPYFAAKFAKDNGFIDIPYKIWVENLLVEKEKAFHIWGKYFENEYLKDFWIPRASVIKVHKVEDVTIDYSKYSARPPLPHQKEAIEKLVGCDKFILADSMGVGKGLTINTLCYTPYGRVEIGNLKVGDDIIGSDGKTYNVTGVFPQGIKELYKITFNDGVSITTDENHLWSVCSGTNGNNSKYKLNKKNLILSTKQMFDEDGHIEIFGQGYNICKKYKIKTYYKEKSGYSKWQIPIVKPIEFKNNDILPIEPYLLGLGLGDGHFKKRSMYFTVSKYDFDEMFDGIDFIKLNMCTRDKENQKGCRIGFNTELIDLGIDKSRSYDKFIPNIYKYSSIEDRISILQGLMDTDGHCLRNNGIIFQGTQYTTVSEQLCNDVMEIVHSLGGIARKSISIGAYKKNGVKHICRKSYRLNIKMPPGINPFRLSRKSSIYNEPQKYKVGRYIKNIERCGEGETVCISVNSPDQLYVAEHAIVTHNTTSAVIAALEVKPKRVLIVCPASLKINWMRELRFLTDRSIFICDGKEFSLEHDFVIVNYDILKNFHSIKKEERENSLILKSNFDLVIFDEAHMISNPKAERTKVVNDFAKTIKRVWLLSGTPMTSRPMNYFNLLSLIDSPVAQNWMAYAIRYCAGYQIKLKNRKVWMTNGAANLDELRERTASQFLRRLKENVLDLPPKIIEPIYLRLDSEKYESIMGEYYEWLETPNNNPSLSMEIAKIMKVRQLIAEEKVENTIEIAENILQEEKKVIIFTNFTNVLKRLVDYFGKKCVYLDGSCTQKHRQDAVDRFQDDENITVFIGNIKAAGVGITLTAAEGIIFNDISFVPGDMAQAEDRAYRYGQKNSVSIFYMIFENTIEGIIYDIVDRKKNIINTVMGDNLDGGEVETTKDIIKKINNRTPTLFE